MATRVIASGTAARAWMTRCLSIAALICCAGCGDSTGPLDSAAGVLQTDVTFYLARKLEATSTYDRYGFTVVATYFNIRHDTVFLERCRSTSRYPIYAVVLADSTNQGAAYDPPWACGSSGCFVVPPRTTRVDTLNIVGPNSWDGVTGEPFGPMEGTFRLRYNVWWCRGATACKAPTAESTSNAFRVTRE